MPKTVMLRRLIKRTRQCVAIVVWGASAGACSDYKPASDTYASSPLAGSEVGDWSCLRPLEAEPSVPGSSGDPIVYTLQLVDLATQAPVTGATVRACGKFDIECDTPLTSDLMANELGVVNVPLTSNFEGYLEIESPTTVPYIFHLQDTGLRTMSDFPLAMISNDDFIELLAAFQLQDAETSGSIGVRAFDCSGRPAAGVELNSDVGGVRWYFVGGLPNVLRTTTDEDGLGGYVGTQTGVRELTAKLLDGRIVSSMSIILRPLWMSAGYLKANPDDE
jgi:hypothetical protein